MNYKIQYLPQFYEDLKQITYYIAVVLKSPSVAGKFIDCVEAAIKERSAYPLIFEPYNLSNCTDTYYYIPVKNYLIFYVVINDTIEIRRILYAKRDISDLI